MTIRCFVVIDAWKLVLLLPATLTIVAQCSFVAGEQRERHQWLPVFHHLCQVRFPGQQARCFWWVSYLTPCIVVSKKENLVFVCSKNLLSCSLCSSQESPFLQWRSFVFRQSHRRVACAEKGGKCSHRTEQQTQNTHSDLTVWRDVAARIHST